MFLLKRKGQRKMLLNLASQHNIKLLVNSHPHLGQLAAFDIVDHSLLQMHSGLQDSTLLLSSYLSG